MPGMYETTQPMKREDLGDKIFNVDADATPFVSALPTGKALNQMVFSWPVEQLPDRAFEGVLDGTDLAAFNSVTRGTLEGVAMWQQESWMVSKLANLTLAAGVQKNEKGHQKALAALNLKIMMERRALSAEECALESSPTPFAMRGAAVWVQSSAQGTKPVPAAYRPNASTQFTAALSGLTESAFLDMCVQAYTDRKGALLDLDGYVGTALKKVFDDFTTVYPVASTSSQPLRSYTSGDSKTILKMVDTLKFSVGEIRLHLTPNLGWTASTGASSAYTTKSGLFLDMAMWEKRFLQNVEVGDLPPQTGGPRGYADVVWSAICKNPLGSMRVWTNS